MDKTLPSVHGFGLSLREGTECGLSGPGDRGQLARKPLRKYGAGRRLAVPVLTANLAIAYQEKDWIGLAGAAEPARIVRLEAW